MKYFLRLTIFVLILLPTLSFYYIYKLKITSNTLNRPIEKTLNQKQTYPIKKNSNKLVFNDSPEQGYGNRIYSMLSSFLVSVITGSRLVVAWSTAEKYIQFDYFEKQSLTNYLDRQGNLLSNYAILSNAYHLRGDSPNTWAYKKTLTGFKYLSIPDNYSTYYFKDYTPYFFELASNLNYAKKLAEFGLVRAETVEKAANSLKDPNLTESQKLENLYLIGFEFAGNILNNYWRPKLSLTRRIEAFSQSNFIDSYVIGLQMRFKYFIKNDEFQLFAECALELEEKIRPVIGNQSVKWFFTSDLSENIHEQILQNLKIMYSRHIISESGPMGHIGLSDDYYERAIVDVELLSRCNKTVITGGSTFGFIASLMSQKRPFYVEGNSNGRNCRQLEFSYPPRNHNNDAVF